MYNTVKNTVKRTRNSAMSVAKNARKAFDKMSQGASAPAVAPTPYVDANGRRINKTNNGAVFTKNVDGNRNYKPVANGIKAVANNAPITNINVNTANTVPKNIRPTNNLKN
jgi:hypothetical protein